MVELMAGISREISSQVKERQGYRRQGGSWRGGSPWWWGGSPWWWGGSPWWWGWLRGWAGVLSPWVWDATGLRLSEFLKNSESFGVNNVKFVDFNRLPKVVNVMWQICSASVFSSEVYVTGSRPSSVPRNVGEKEWQKLGFECFLCFCFPQNCKEVVLKTIKILRLLLVSSLTSGLVAFFRPCFIYYYGFVSADLNSKQK